jgi:hypothetical protein
MPRLGHPECGVLLADLRVNERRRVIPARGPEPPCGICRNGDSTMLKRKGELTRNAIDRDGPRHVALATRIPQRSATLAFLPRGWPVTLSADDRFLSHGGSGANLARVLLLQRACPCRAVRGRFGGEFIDPCYRWKWARAVVRGTWTGTR